MPELPEVEVTRLGLLPRLPGRRVDKITWSGRRLRLPIPRKLLTAHIRGAVIRTIDRRGKYLLFRMSGGSTMVIHLGMTGKLALLEGNTPPARHDHLRVLLNGGLELRFNDSRRFGSVAVWPPGESARLEKEFLAGIGIEPLSDGFTPARLMQLAGKGRQPVKSFLMDARKVAGIGNIYANEILFAAGIHPLTPASRIKAGEWERITAAAGRILRDAIECGGSSISDFLGTSGNPGYFQIRFRVYGRTGEPCRQCGTPIRKTVVAGRATYTCPRCQVRRD
jgi:formamidopyrimidine-DNA glycosylase